MLQSHIIHSEFPRICEDQFLLPLNIRRKDFDIMYILNILYGHVIVKNYLMIYLFTHLRVQRDIDVQFQFKLFPF